MTSLSRVLRSPASIGGLLSLASLPVHLMLPHALSVQMAGTLVAVIGAIYVGFALQKGSLRQIAIEIVAATGFLGAALGGMWLNAWLIPAAYVLHGAWDFAHHRNHRNHRMVETPAWYPPFCAVYDWIYAAGLVAIWVWGG